MSTLDEWEGSTGTVLRRLRLAPIVVVNPGVLVDNGTDLAPGPPLKPIQVPLADLKGCKFYDDLVAQLTALEAPEGTGAP